VERVVRLAQTLGRKARLTERQQQALRIAAWWHDASRVLTRRPSLVWMPLLDDTLSAFMLWYQTIRHRLFGSTVGLATRLIFCKSLGTGTILTRIILGKANRLVLNILKDADALDVLRIERVKKIFAYVEGSHVYHFGYKVNTWWMLTSHHLHMKTTMAREYLTKMIREFLVWIRQEYVLAWHIAQYGREWAEKNIRRVEDLLSYVQELNFQSAQ
jgi:hypothetical protein